MSQAQGEFGFSYQQSSISSSEEFVGLLRMIFSSRILFVQFKTCQPTMKLAACGI